MSLFEMSVVVVLNIVLIAGVALGCAAIPFYIGQMLHRPDLGNPRAKAVVVIATFAGLLGGLMSAFVWGILIAIIFSVGVVVVSHSKSKRVQE